jgi:uncharacterized protein YecE (DUF72 family)
MNAHPAFRVGISGWVYAPWRGKFYPDKLPQRRELEFASRQLPTIELNGSFYGPQKPKTWQAWHDATPEGFVLSVKGPKFITQVRRLRDVHVPLANFFASGVANLGRRLGPILWQLPPTLPYDPALLEAFLELLPMDTRAAGALARQHDEKAGKDTVVDFAAANGNAGALRHALEVRHQSYLDPSLPKLLRKYGVALVSADTGGRWPELLEATADFCYFRLHGADEKLYVSGYTDAQLKEWARNIKRASDGKRDVFCYFDNTMKEYAPLNALRLMKMLKVQWAPPSHWPPL